MTAEQSHHRSGRPDAVGRWAALVNDPDLTVTQRGLMIAAQHQTDRAWSMAAHGQLPDISADAWCQFALSTYEYLRDTGAYAHLSASHPPQCTVRADDLAAWLASPANADRETVAEAYAVDDTFHLGGGDIADRIQELVTRAQSEHILYAPDHHVQLWQVADEGFLITVDPPHGPRLGSHHVSARHLLPHGLSGHDAAITVLTETAVHVNIVLNEQAAQLQAARASATNPAVTDSHQPNRSLRAFRAPAVAATDTPAPAQPSPDTGPARRHR
jgi:hypothetical protein